MRRSWPVYQFCGDGEEEKERVSGGAKTTEACEGGDGTVQSPTSKMERR